MEELKEVSEQITLVRIEIGKLATKMDMFASVQNKLDQVDKVADHASDTAKAAHKRLDRMEKIVYGVGGTIVCTVIAGVLKVYGGG